MALILLKENCLVEITITDVSENAPEYTELDKIFLGYVYERGQLRMSCSKARSLTDEFRDS